jgi:hypothetical protein
MPILRPCKGNLVAEQRRVATAPPSFSGGSLTCLILRRGEEAARAINCTANSRPGRLYVIVLKNQPSRRCRRHGLFRRNGWEAHPCRAFAGEQKDRRFCKSKTGSIRSQAAVSPCAIRKLAADAHAPDGTNLTEQVPSSNPIGTNKGPSEFPGLFKLSSHSGHTSLP